MAKQDKVDGGILVPVDFSPTSREALHHAAELADGLHKKLVVLHVVHDPGDAPGYYKVKGRNKVLRRSEDVAEEMLADFIQQMHKDFPGINALNDPKTMLVTGLPATRILEIIKLLSPWMVVMGSEGRTGLSHMLLGSKAEHVVRLSPTPVTIIKSPTTD